MPPKRKVKEVTPLLSDAVSNRAKGKISGHANRHGGDDDVVELPVPNKPAKKARKTQPQAKKNRDEDDAFGPQKPATVEQYLMELNNKSKQFIQHFKDEITEEADSAHTALARSKRKLGQVQTLRQDLPGLGEDHATPDVKDNPLFQQTQKMIHVCRNIQRCHETVERNVHVEGLTPPREMWKEDKQQMKRLLGYGRQYGEKMAENLLASEEREVVIAKDGNITEETEQSMLDMFEHSRKATAGESWGSAAKAQMNAFSEVIKTLATTD